MLSDKAVELGRLIGQSAEYQAVKRANDALNGDKEVVAALQRMEALRRDAQALIDDLIRSFAFFQKFVKPESRLLLVGDHRGFERYFDRLQELVRELRVDEVVFTGQVDDDELYAYYRLADVFLCLSEHEGFGVPLQEAMLFGVP